MISICTSGCVSLGKFTILQSAKGLPGLAALTQFLVQTGRMSMPGVSARVGLEAHERDMAAAARQIATQQDTIVTLKSQLADQKAANAELSRRTLPRLQQASSSSTLPFTSVSAG